MAQNANEISSSDLRVVRKLHKGKASQVDLCIWNKKDASLLVVRKSFLEGDFLRYKHQLTKEISILLNLKHENIVAAYGYVHTRTEFSLVMGYCKSESYYKHFIETNYANRRREFEALRFLPLKLKIWKEIVCGMEYLHSRSCLHLNLKPENVLLDENFQVKLASFGRSALKTIATLSRQSSSRRLQDNETSSLLYTPPEHLADLTYRATVKSDIYGFAILAWTILSDLRPYDDDLSQNSIAPLLTEIQNNKRPKLNKIPSVYPVEVNEILQISWSTDPASRPTFGEIKNKLLPVIRACDKFEESVKAVMAEVKTLADTPSPTWARMKEELPHELGIHRIRYGNFPIIVANILGVEGILPVFTCEAEDVLTGNKKTAQGGAAGTACKRAVGNLILAMVAKEIYSRPSDITNIPA